MSALLQLAERCEKATGPDRELDCAIAVALERTNEGGSGFHRVFPDDSVFEQVRALLFTASLDAAMTLVPEGYLWGCGNDAGEPGGWPWAWCDESDELPGDYLTFAATPALALCAAALRARGETA